MATFKDVQKARQAYLKKVRKYSLIGIISLAGLLILNIWTFFVFFPLMLSWGAFLFYLVAGSKERANYRQVYKDYFVEKALRKVFEVKQYDHRMGLNRSVLRDTEMINMGDRYSSNDYVAGEYKDVGFVQADVCIEAQTQRAGDESSYATIFKGRWMVFEFPKKFNFQLEVVEKGFRTYKVPKVNIITGRRLKKVKVESAEFNKLFTLYAEDGFEAFYLLDPYLIDSITQLGENYKGQMLLCFIDNKLHVGLHDNKDAFEPPAVIAPLDEAKESEKIRKDMQLITDFVDKLKLDQKIFR